MDYILSFTPRFLSESAFDFAVLSIESDDNIGSVLQWQQLPKMRRWDRRGRDRILVGYITTYAISAYHH